MSATTRRPGRLRRTWGSWGAGLLTGAYAFPGLALSWGAPPRQLVALALFGALFGGLVVLLMRAFPIRRWAMPFAGLLAGLLVGALFVRKQEDGGLALIGALLGLLIGLFECARRDAPESDRCDDLPHRPRPSGGVQSVE